MRGFLQPLRHLAAPQCPNSARKMGAMLAEMPKNEGSLLRGTKMEPRETPTLSDLGISKKLSAEAQPGIYRTCPSEINFVL